MFKRIGSLLLTGILIMSLSGVALAAPGSAPANRVIPGRYIVVFKPGTPAADVSAAAERTRGLGGQVDFVYESALTGFAGNLPEQAVFGLSHTPDIEFIAA